MQDDPAPRPRPAEGLFPVSRVEAFSDGVIAIAITLLVLDLIVPSRATAADHGLARALLEEWPSYLAYLVSFVVIGIIWVNHHTVLARVRWVNRPILFANLALLLSVSVLPFPTRLLAEYLTAGADAHVAAAVYSGAMLLMGLTFLLLWRTVARDSRLLHDPLDPADARAAMLRFGLGSVFYLATIGLSFLSAIATLAVHAALAAYYCLDQLTTVERQDPDPDPDPDPPGRGRGGGSRAS